MIYTRNVATFLSGLTSGLVLILACSDDSPSDSDAATCDCLPAEAPLAGRAVETERPFTLPPLSERNGQAGTNVRCPIGGVLLSGGCAASVGAVSDIVLTASYPVQDSWSCEWKNNTNEAVPVRAIARCLMPAQ